MLAVVHCTVFEYHEAGYDSYITAIVAIKIAAKLNKEGTARKGEKEAEEDKIMAAMVALPPDFGMHNGYVTATDTSSLSSSDTSLPTASPAQNATGLEYSSHEGDVHEPAASNPSNTSPDAQHPLSAFIAVEESKSKLSHKSRATTASELNNVDKLRSAFSTITIYDTLPSSSTTSHTYRALRR